MGDILRVMLYDNPPHDGNDTNQIVDKNALATCVHSSRCAVQFTIQTSPEALVLRHDMKTTIPFIVLVNLYSIQQKQRQLIYENA